MRTILVAAALAVLAAGCGSDSIESRVQSEYGPYAKQHGFDAPTQNVASVKCTHEPTSNFDGWCRIHPKGFHLTYDVPYQGDKVLWGESGPMEAPGS